MILFIIVGAGLSTFVMVLALLGRPRDNLLQARLENVAIGDADAEREQVLSAPLSARLVQPAVEKLGKFMLRRTKQGQIERLRLLLARSGSTKLPEQLLAEKVVGGGMGIFIGLVLAIFVMPGVFLQLAAFMAAAGAGYTAPSLSLSRQITARTDEIRSDLSGVLDLMTIAMEAGLGFDAALARVAAFGEGILNQEFQQTLNEIRLGRPRMDALNALATRNDIEELTMFVDGVVQAAPLGVSVAGVLRVQAEEMRRRRRQRAELAGHQAPIKMLLPMMGCIFPTIFIILLGPAGLSIIDSMTGTH